MGEKDKSTVYIEDLETGEKTPITGGVEVEAEPQLPEGSIAPSLHLCGYMVYLCTEKEESMVDKIFEALAAVTENFVVSLTTAIEGAIEFIKLFLAVLMIALYIIGAVVVLLATIVSFVVFIGNIPDNLPLSALGLLGCCLGITIGLWKYDRK